MVSLADAVGLDEATVREQLTKFCRPEVTIKGSKDKPYISVPSAKQLKDWLIEDGFDADVLEPMQAVRDGAMRFVKWIENPQYCDDGCVKFKVTWQGRSPPTNVCCHALNPAARYYVSSFYVSYLCVAGHTSPGS